MEILELLKIEIISINQNRLSVGIKIIVLISSPCFRERICFFFLNQD